MNCVLCGSEITNHSPNRKYCGSITDKIGCSYKAKLENHKRYDAKNIIRKKEIWAKWYEMKSPTRYWKQIKKKTTHRSKKRTQAPQTIQEVKERTNAYFRDKYKNDIQHRLGVLLRKRISDALHGKTKSASTQQLLGCDKEYLIKYLSEKFSDGMTWDNHGIHGWHIDHIRPCSSFDLSKPCEQEKCFHYTNLQPLWATDNFLKSNKY